MADKIFDPQFPLPPIEDAKYSEEQQRGLASDPADTIINDVINPGTPIQLQPPANIIVVDQIQRTADDGTLTTDLVLEVQNTPGAIDYEARVSRL